LLIEDRDDLRRRVRRGTNRFAMYTEKWGKVIRAAGIKAQNKAGQADDVSSALSPLLLRSLQKIVCCDERRKGPTGDLRPRKDQSGLDKLTAFSFPTGDGESLGRASANDGLAMSVARASWIPQCAKNGLVRRAWGDRFLKQVAAAGLAAGASTCSGASARND
jgi:hypothetical protein